ncbi:DNA polymerase III subunit delta' [Planomicrobium sp. CPCC 101079]|uniref:DNA polymerase III subunit delta' n=1 Tax=Planomicrobium sp. CPCC 101079 TaxID=2599618 RepID=UPI0011B45917|nr:DNA polymerase III subunit delta' [Planomicrobium sp. CPCC 101079]TWT06200.1 DNA polymerase III subunit delta' [Planomicrobium sp. CPCC 101079]
MQKTIEEIQGMQPVVMKRLQGAYEKDRLAHAYLFEGPAGAGKKEITHFFVKLLLCETPVENVPCETCRSCKLYNSGNHPSIVFIEPDGQNIKIDQIRDLISTMNKTGLNTGRKIYVIQEADRMNNSSANALLKFLEEPEMNVTAILLTERLNAIMTTIRSRCQLVSFQPLSRPKLMEKLMADGMTASMAATVSMLTQSAEEAVELSSDEQFAQARKLVLRMVEVAGTNVHEALLMVQADWLPFFKEKEDAERGLDMLLFAYRDIATVKAGLETVCTYPDMEEIWKQMALQRSFSALSKQLQAILQAKQQLQRNMNRTLLMEQLMLNLQEG